MGAEARGSAIPVPAVAALAVAGLDVDHGGVPAVRGLDLICADGAVTALLGRNGAGKSTTLGAIVGLLPPRRGTVRLFGAAIEGRAPEDICRLGIGYVPQGRRIFPSLSVAEHLAVAARAPRGEGRGAAWDRAAVEALFPRLRERRGQLAGSLSGGEQQMLALARALVTNPRLLILDEPSEGLAPKVGEEVAAAIRALKAGGLPILLVEHNLPLALGLADACVVLSTGEVAWSGLPGELGASPDLLARHLGVH